MLTLPAVCSLACCNDMNKGAVRQVIARVGGLTRLNGSDVSTSERRDAEVCYLRTRTGAA